MMNKDERQAKREKELQDSIDIMEAVSSEILEDRENDSLKNKMSFTKECDNLIDTVKNIKAATVIQIPWWFFYIGFYVGLSFIEIGSIYAFSIAQDITQAGYIAMYVLWAIWPFITILFSIRIPRDIKKPKFYQLCRVGDKEIYLIYEKGCFAYSDGQNHIQLHDGKIGKATFKKVNNFYLFEGITSCNKFKATVYRNKKKFKGENIKYGSDVKVMTDLNNIPYRFVLRFCSGGGGTTCMRKRVLDVNNENMKYYVPKTLYVALKKYKIDFPEIPNVVEIPDEKIWKYITVKDLKG